MSKASHSISEWDAESLGRLPIEGIKKRIETHLSVVALTATLAFKFKKPVDYSFVDYSTFQKRWAAACNEIYLNRRLTTGVYLGVRLVERVSGAYHWKGELIENPTNTPPGPISDNYDVAVVMRRLDDEMFLSSLVLQDKVSPEEIEYLAQRLLEFHSGVTLKEVDIDQYLAELKENVLDNFKALRDQEVTKLLGEPYRAILAHGQKFVERFLESHQKLLTERAKTSCIVDGHGDLRLEHIICEPVTGSSTRSIQIFDCIEFNPAIRRNDLLSDVGFLSMDLEYFKRRDLAKVLEYSYFKWIGDTDLGQLLSFFKHYRAMVRAKVHALRALQLDPGCGAQLKELGDCRAYLSLGARYASGLNKPVLIIVCGLTGTGKSSLVQELKLWLYADAPNSDVIRKQTLDVTSAAAARSLEYGAGIYNSSASEATYNEMFSMARENLRYCNPIILDASFLKKSHREEAGKIAHQFGVPFVIVECTLDKEVILERLNNRLLEKSSISDGRPEILEAQIQRWEQITENECDLHIKLDMGNSLDQLAQDVITKIAQPS